jgi:hypothetical protein
VTASIAPAQIRAALLTRAGITLVEQLMRDGTHSFPSI